MGACPGTLGLGWEGLYLSLLWQLLFCNWDRFPFCVKFWLLMVDIVPSSAICSLRERKGIRSEEERYCGKGRRQSHQLIARWSRATMSSFLHPHCYWRNWGTLPIRSLSVSFPYLLLSPFVSLHVGHSASREAAVGWTFKSNIISSFSSFGHSQASWGNPHPIWRGSLGPHPMTSSQAAGELGWPAVTWRQSGPWGRVRPRKAQCGMTWLLQGPARTFHPGFPRRLAASLEARPTRPRLWALQRPRWGWKQKTIRVANETQASWLIYSAAPGGIGDETWTAPWKGQVRIVPKRTVMRPNHVCSPQKSW